MSQASFDRRRNELNNSAPVRFVPSGVDAQSWIGFEQRIQERRFRALLNSITAAIERGDSISARVALEEARELRPHAPELAEAAGRVALLPMASPVRNSRSYMRLRAANAVGLLFVGMALLVAIDWIRPNAPDAEVTQPAAAPAVISPELQSASAEPAPVLLEDAAPVEPPAEVAAPPAAPAIGTFGIRPAVAVERDAPPRPLARRPAIQPAAVVQTPVVVTSGEVPDDYVAPQVVRRDPAAPAASAAPVSAPVTPSRTTQAAETTTAGPPIIPPAPVARPEAAPAAAAAAIVPREDETHVATVLNQYARAYGQLDASAAREVWPSVNERALARAFAGLESQNVAFENCNIDVRGQTANASCRGRASYVGKVGSRELRTEPRQWTFELRRDGEAWKIQSAQTTVAQ
jgi:hypothetical protein